MIFQARCLGATVEDTSEKFIGHDDLNKGQEDAIQKAIQEQMTKKGMRQHDRPRYKGKG